MRTALKTVTAIRKQTVARQLRRTNRVKGKHSQLAGKDRNRSPARKPRQLRRRRRRRGQKNLQVMRMMKKMMMRKRKGNRMKIMIMMMKIIAAVRVTITVTTTTTLKQKTAHLKQSNRSRLVRGKLPFSEVRLLLLLLQRRRARKLRERVMMRTVRAVKMLRRMMSLKTRASL